MIIYIWEALEKIENKIPLYAGQTTDLTNRLRTPYHGSSLLGTPVLKKDDVSVIYENEEWDGTTEGGVTEGIVRLGYDQPTDYWAYINAKEQVAINSICKFARLFAGKFWPINCNNALPKYPLWERASYDKMVDELGADYDTKIVMGLIEHYIKLKVI